MGHVRKSRRHALGQHFLASRGILEKILGVIDPRPEDFILEIGAGRGQLTRPLAARAGHVIAVEKDPRLADNLKAAVPASVEVVVADILSLDFRVLVRMRGKIGGGGGSRSSEICRMQSLRPCSSS